MLLRIHEVFSNRQEGDCERRAYQYTTRVRAVEFDNVRAVRINRHHRVDDVGDAETVA